MLTTLEIGAFPDQTKTRISNAERTERDASRLREELVSASQRQVEFHEQTLKSVLAHKTDAKAGAPLAELLTELTEAYGLGWSELARLVGVSVPAVRKWRQGGDITPTRRGALARLCAFLEMLEDEAVKEPVAWLQLPFDSDNMDLTKAQLYSQGAVSDLLLYARGYIDLNELIRRAPVTSRSTSTDEVVAMADGHLSIVSRS